MTSRTELDELVLALGGDTTAVRTTDLDRFREPARGDRGPLGVVVLPRTTEQVREVVGWARRHRIRLLPQGANTGLVGASTPGPHDGGVVVLSTDRLVGEPQIDPVDRTVVAHAGTRLSELNDRLAAHGLALAIDLGADPSLGGMAATNTGGARMLRHGDMRRHVLGVEAVLADEAVSVVDELSVARKDNTGLALTELLVGSGGALGVITRVALQVEPLPTEVACAWLAVTDAQEVLGALLALERDWSDRLSAFEVVSRSAMSTALELVAGLHRPFAGEVPELSVLVEFVGSHGTEEALVGALARLHELGLVADGVIGPAATTWAVRHAISEGLRLAGTVIGFDVSVPRSSLPAFVAEVRARVHEAFPRTLLADFGHWGDGGVHCSVIVPRDDPLDPAELESLRDLVFGIAVEGYGGSFSGEHGIGPINAIWWHRTRSPGSQQLTRGIKHLCDPLDVLGHPGMPYA